MGQCIPSKNRNSPAVSYLYLNYFSEDEKDVWMTIRDFSLDTDKFKFILEV